MTSPAELRQVESLILKALDLTLSRGQVTFYPYLGRAVVKTYGKSGIEVELARRASRESGWDVEVVDATTFDLNQRDAISVFSNIPGVDVELASRLVDRGFGSLDDLSTIDARELAHLGLLESVEADRIIDEVERLLSD